MNQNVSDDKYISLICNGEFDAIPGFKIGELFESFFDNINYNVTKDEKNAYVDFTGEAMCDDKPCNVLIRFRVDDNIETFEISAIKVNDKILSECEAMDLLEDIAFVGGAVLEDDYCQDCTSDDCSNCLYDDFDDEDEEDDDDDQDDDEDD